MRSLQNVERSPEQKLSKVLIRKSKTVALAESCTGGLAASRITDISGSSKYFKGGVIAYSNRLKVSLLGVAPSTIKEHGAVSAETACEMAEGARLLMKTDFAASITGIAGPSGSRPGKPVGLAYMAFSDKKNTILKKVICKGGRESVKKKFADALIELVVENI